MLIVRASWQRRAGGEISNLLNWGDIARVVRNSFATVVRSRADITKEITRCVKLQCADHHAKARAF
jgi:hypothetical protein